MGLYKENNNKKIKKEGKERMNRKKLQEATPNSRFLGAIGTQWFAPTA